MSIHSCNYGINTNSNIKWENEMIEYEDETTCNPWKTTKFTVIFCIAAGVCQQ